MVDKAVKSGLTLGVSLVIAQLHRLDPNLNRFVERVKDGTNKRSSCQSFWPQELMVHRYGNYVICVLAEQGPEQAKVAVHHTLRKHLVRLARMGKPKRRSVCLPALNRSLSHFLGRPFWQRNGFDPALANGGENRTPCLKGTG